MDIVKAQTEMVEKVKAITYRTILEIYSHYYAKGAVDFFLAHHKADNIMKDIRAGAVYLIKDGEEAIGTVTIKENGINRLFVLPEYQHRGVGRRLLDFAEEMIGREYTEIMIDSSLPAKKIYLQRGYVTVSAHEILTENGDVLCYDVMMKNSNYKNQKLNYEGRKFVPQSNTENGEVDGQTLFCYHQRESVIWAEYSGGEIKQGFLIGTADDAGNLTFTYQHLNEANQLRLGQCNSRPVVLEDGRIEMHEEWQWMNGDQSKGKSVIVEVE